MQLLCTPTSPFARKVRMFAIEKGVAGQLEVVVSNPLDDPPTLLQVNPLSKIPALLLDDGAALYDSRVICEYLDSLAETPVLIPRKPDAYWPMMRRQALADGLMDAAVSMVFERRRPDGEQSPSWIARWEGKTRRALQSLDGEHPSLVMPQLDGIAVAAALAYLAFRLPELDWQDCCPALADWWAITAQRASVQETAPTA